MRTLGEFPPLEYRSTSFAAYDRSKNVLYNLVPETWIRPGKPGNVLCHVLNLDTSEWELIVPEGRPGFIESSIITVMGNSIFIVFGKDDVEYHNSVASLNTESWNWKTYERDNRVARRAGHSVLSINDRLFVFGGFNEVPSQNTKRNYLAVDMNYTNPPYDHTLNWLTYSNVNIALDSMNVPSREGAASAATPEGKIIIYGGMNDTGALDSVTIFVPENRKFLEIDAIGTKFSPGNRCYSSISMIKNNLIVFGGRNGAQWDPTFYNDIYVLCCGEEEIDIDTIENEEGITDFEIPDYIMEQQELYPMLFENDMRQALFHCLKEEVYADMAFSIGDVLIPAHKILLLNRTSKLDKILLCKRDHDENDIDESEISLRKTEDSYSMWEGDAQEMSIIPVPDDWDTDIFRKYLIYLYTGKIEIGDKYEALELSEMAYDFLSDELMIFCRNIHQYPAVFEEEVQIGKQLRKAVGSEVGSDIFLVFQRKKIHAHKVILYLFQPYFRKLLDENERLKYIRINTLDNDNADSRSLVEFLRMVYCNFSIPPRRIESDVGTLFELGVEFDEFRLINILSKISSLHHSNVGNIYVAASKFGYDKVVDNCIRYLEHNFYELSRDAEAISMWPKQFIRFVRKKILKKNQSNTFFSWLDVLWFSHHANENSLNEKTLTKLPKYINVDNVTLVLIGAHHTGSKELRSICVDFMVMYSADIESYNRMNKMHEDLFSINTLSNSLSSEMAEKVQEKVVSLRPEEKSKDCSFCNSKFSFFARKHSCVLCKRVSCSNCINRNTVLPPVFGYTRARSVCTICKQLVTLISE
eukprot:TRINITY_DN1976_c0_g2_i2.p1 TRINITY_DN1976_c0_g2~~TRINITY_DN1976_c0_g2_i2.p1  ORF type:complete len:886 (-),score=148.10 TRINITY_DN1976_c0_g2_i2:38-2470(-)